MCSHIANTVVGIWRKFSLLQNFYACNIPTPRSLQYFSGCEICSCSSETEGHSHEFWNVCYCFSFKAAHWPCMDVSCFCGCTDSDLHTAVTIFRTSKVRDLSCATLMLRFPRAPFIHSMGWGQCTAAVHIDTRAHSSEVSNTAKPGSSCAYFLISSFCVHGT